jgi:hypothetical protein
VYNIDSESGNGTTDIIMSLTDFINADVWSPLHARIIAISVLASNATAAYNELPDDTTVVTQGTKRSDLIALSDTQLERFST